MSGRLGDWLCSLNRHKLILIPPVPPGRRISGPGIPEHSYLLDLGDTHSPPPGYRTVTSSDTTLVIAQQRPICGRRRTSLEGGTTEHLLGHEAL